MTNKWGFAIFFIFIKKLRNYETTKCHVNAVHGIQLQYLEHNAAHKHGFHCLQHPITTKIVPFMFWLTDHTHLKLSHSVTTTQYIRTLSTTVHCIVYALCFIPVYTKAFYCDSLFGFLILLWFSCFVLFLPLPSLIHVCSSPDHCLVFDYALVSHLGFSCKFV